MQPLLGTLASSKRRSGTFFLVVWSVFVSPTLLSLLSVTPFSDGTSNRRGVGATVVAAFSPCFVVQHRTQSLSIAKTGSIGAGGDRIPSHGAKYSQIIRHRRPEQQPNPRNLVVAYYGVGDMSGAGAAAGRRRQAQIRQKIAQLKKEGRISQKPKFDDNDQDDDDDENANSKTSIKDEYSDKIRQKLGETKSKMLGYTSSSTNKNKDDDELLEDDEDNAQIVGRIGSLPTMDENGEEASTTSSSLSAPAANESESSQKKKTPLIDPSLFEGEMDNEDEVSEEDLVDLVAQRMMEKRKREQREKEERRFTSSVTSSSAVEGESGSNQATVTSPSAPQSTSSLQPGQLTSGVGGSWNKNETANVDLYQPKTGSWGAFPRPRDISKAYGGGRRVGSGYSDEEARQNSVEETRKRLQQYREKAGIEVQSEKDHAAEIEEAVRVGGLAMQRGMYSTAVSALEKVTKYCSTNSKVGGKVFLELAMAYEAVGRTDEAITVYATLTKCRIEEIKFNAKKLLYGIEAMEFMRNEMKDSNFSRKKVRNTFIDTTGLGNIAQNFDDVYQTAYIDMNGSFYKRLTESVVRSFREARQILLRATNAGEVERTRIVQALRSLSRNFDDALDKEIEATRVQEPVAVMDGKPIVARERSTSNKGEFGDTLSNANSFVLADSQQMFENLNGEWRLQLLADKRGDGVKFFNNTLSWQRFDMEKQSFEAETPIGLGNMMQLSGTVEFKEDRRVIQRRKIDMKGGGMLGAFLKNPFNAGVLGVVQVPQQVMTVDSTLLVTRGIPTSDLADSSKKNKNTEKDYFAVWRRIE